MPEAVLNRHYKFVLYIEHCVAVRPSQRIKSLSGSAERYAELKDQLDRGLSTCVAVMSAEVETQINQQLIKNDPTNATDEDGSVVWPTMLGPSAIPRACIAPAPSRAFPRIGAFEVAFSIVTKATGTVRGPFLLYSKLCNGNFPRCSYLISNLEKAVHVLLRPPVLMTRANSGPIKRQGSGMLKREEAEEAATEAAAEEKKRAADRLEKISIEVSVRSWVWEGWQHS